MLAIDRPPANALDVELLGQLVSALEALVAAPPRALVVTGRDGFFSAGADLKAIPSSGPDVQRLMVTSINRMAIAAYELACPAVAAVTGHAIAGGMVLALCFDYRVASATGRYGLTEVKVGVPYPQAPIRLLGAELGPHAARRLALRSELTDAEECLRLGVFDEVLQASDVTARAIEVAAGMAAMPAEVYARTKRELRGEALAAMKSGAEREPLLDGWVQP